MWSRLQERAQKVTENAQNLAVRAGDALREAQEDENDEFRGEDYGFVVGEDAEKDEELRKAKKSIEQLEMDLQEREQEKKLAQTRMIEAEAETRKEAELRNAAENELNWYRGEKDTLQRTLAAMEEEKAELTDQLADALKNTGSNLERKTNSQQLLEQQVRELESKTDMMRAEIVRYVPNAASLTFEQTIGSLSKILGERAQSNKEQEWCRRNEDRIRMLGYPSADTEVLLDGILNLALSSQAEEMTKNSTTDAQIQELQESLNSSKRDCFRLQAHVQELEASRMELEEQVARAELSEIKQPNQNSEQRYDEDMAKALAEVERLKSEIEETRKGGTESIQTLEDKLKRTLDEMNAITEDYALLKESYDETVKELQIMASEQISQDATQEEFSRLAAAKQQLEEELGLSIQAKEAAIEDLGRLAEERDALLSHVAELSARDTTNGTASVSDEALVRELRDEVRSLNDELRQKEAELAQRSEGGQASTRGDGVEKEELTAELDHLRRELSMDRAKAEVKDDQIEQKSRRLQLVEDTLSKTRDECEELKKALATASSQVSNAQTASVKNRQLQSELNKVQALVKSETRARKEAEEMSSRLQLRLESLEKKYTYDQKANEEAFIRSVGETENTSRRAMDLEKELEISKAKVGDLEKKLQRKENELQMAQNTAQNLQSVLEDFQAAQDTEIETSLMRLQREIAAEKEKSTSLERELEEKKEEVAGLEKIKLEKDEKVSLLLGDIERLKEADFELKEEMEKVLSRAHEPDAESQLVDRNVVKQLLVSYFDRGQTRKRDVLELISRMLFFTEEEKVQVGLKRRGLNSLFSSFVRGEARETIVDVSDKWVEYLMKETEEEDLLGAAETDEDEKQEKP